jgi:hypothetical protein
MNNKIISGIIGVVIIAGGAFYGGMVYGKSSVPTRGGSGQFVANANSIRGAGARGGMNGGFTIGEIISKDATSITVKMQDGSTKIAFVSTSTQVMKSSVGSLGDLSVGTNVTINGTANSDGSITAQSVQIRPVGSLPFGGGRINQ